MIIVEHYKQNDNLKNSGYEDRNVFCERIQTIINEDIKVLKGKLLNISFFLNTDNNLSCVVTMKVSKRLYYKNYGR